MLRNAKLLFLLLGLVSLAVLGIEVQDAYAWSCNSYSNSKPTWIQDFGPVCAYSGSGCRECISGGGYTVCVDSTQHPVCTDYPDL